MQGTLAARQGALPVNAMQHSSWLIQPRRPVWWNSHQEWRFTGSRMIRPLGSKRSPHPRLRQHVALRRFHPLQEAAESNGWPGSDRDLNDPPAQRRPQLWPREINNGCHSLLASSLRSSFAASRGLHIRNMPSQTILRRPSHRRVQENRIEVHQRPQAFR